MIESPRQWFCLPLEREWEPGRDGNWTGEGGARLEFLDILESRRPITSDDAVEAHEHWCEHNRLNAQQVRLDENDQGVTCLRSYGETQADEFLMVAHLWAGRRFSVVSLRSSLHLLSDDDLRDLLQALAGAHPL